MGKKYKGTGGVSLVPPDQLHSEGYLVVQLKPEDINFFMKIMEGFPHLGFAVPLQPREGLMAIHATRETIGEVRSILANFPRYIKVTENQARCSD